MPVQITMPALSPTMSEGKLAKWHKQEGDAVASGDLLAEIETDKATMELEAVEEGVLAKILIAEGTEAVAVNATIAILLEDGEDAESLDDIIISETDSAAPQSPPPAAEQVAKTKNQDVFASPLARRMATQAGIDITSINGSGPHGRIIKRDIDAFDKSAATSALTSTQLPMLTDAGYSEVPNTTTRKIIAQRLFEAKRDIPHFYLTIDCRIDSLLGTRKKLNNNAPEGEGAYKISVNDFVVRAVALAMKDVPAANASWNDDAIRVYNDVDVAVAVAAPGGLITPVVRQADNKGLATLSNEIKELAGRAREGKLLPEEYQGGGFTVTNLGMFAIKEFSAIINPPQSCILAVGAGEARPVVKDGALAIATVMTCTLSVDHRSVDGVVGSSFLAAFKRYIEEPLTMLL